MQSAAKVEKLYHDIGDLDMHLLKVLRDKSFLNIDNNDRSYFKKKKQRRKENTDVGIIDCETCQFAKNHKNVNPIIQLILIRRVVVLLI